MDEAQDRYLIRASAHARATLTLARLARFRNGVSDLDVAAVFYAIEAEKIVFTHTPTGRWIPPPGQAGAMLRGVDTSATIREMIRTGLVRCWPSPRGERIHPAKVHLRDTQDASVSLCRAGIEGMPGGRVRIVNDLTLVDCLDCEASMVSEGPHGL